MSPPKNAAPANASGARREPWFDAAARATRVRFDGHSPREQETEWSVLRKLYRRRRWYRVWWPFPLVAVIGVSAAWAEEMSEGVDWLALEIQSVWQPDLPATAEAEKGDTEPRLKAKPGLGSLANLRLANIAIQGLEPPLLEPSDASLAAPETPSAAQQVPRRSPAADAATMEAPDPSPPFAPSDLTLYKSAHHAHFVERDWAAALRGWDAYLANAQRGQFIPEARYNRGIALAALGQNQDAIEAFTPFAQGVYGNYRVAEAKARIERLSNGSIEP